MHLETFHATRDDDYKWRSERDPEAPLTCNVQTEAYSEIQSAFGQYGGLTTHNFLAQHLPIITKAAVLIDMVARDDLRVTLLHALLPLWSDFGGTYGRSSTNETRLSSLPNLQSLAATPSTQTLQIPNPGICIACRLPRACQSRP